MTTDYARLRLKYHGDTAMMEQILQLECREKCASKLPHAISHPGFTFPSLALAEMSTSEAVAGIHASMIAPGATVLDMTAGLGIDTFAFAAEGHKVTAVEIDPVAARILSHNASELGLADHIETVEADSVEWLAANDRTFDVIFIDPARRDSSGRHFSLRDCHPDVTTIMPLLLERSGKVIVKASPMLNVDELEGAGAECVVIGTRRECKEMVYIISSADKSRGGRVSCLTVGEGVYEVSPGAVQTFGLPETGQILLQPYPAVMKGGGTQTITSATKLHPFSLLFHASAIPAGFPGEGYLITEILPFDKRTVKEFSKRHATFNVAVRNFPQTAPELVKRLHIKEGGEQMMFGTTGPCGERLLIICHRL